MTLPNFWAFGDRYIQLHASNFAKNRILATIDADVCGLYYSEYDLKMHQVSLFNYAYYKEINLVQIARLATAADQSFVMQGGEEELVDVELARYEVITLLTKTH